MTMVTGRVTNHAITIRDSIGRCRPAPAVTIVPAIPDVTMWVVLTGSPLKPEIPISTADTVSAAAPCAGVR
jgi:hypothetical protein